MNSYLWEGSTKTERQKCIPDSGVSIQTGPRVPSPKPRKQTAHIETHTSQLASVNPHSFTKLWLGTPTPFMNRTNCHTDNPAGLVLVRPVVYFHHYYLPLSLFSFHDRFHSFTYSNVKWYKIYKITFFVLKPLALHLHEECQSPYSTKRFLPILYFV